LHYSIENENRDLIRILRIAGLDPYQVDYDNISAFDLCRSEEMKTILLAGIASCHFVDLY
jgi:hypothetical protein